MRTRALKFYVTHTKFCVVGGGAAGLNISSHLAKQFDPKDIRIFESQKVHDYQPGWTMIGGDLVDGSITKEENKNLFNKNIHWTQEKVRLVNPDKNLITTESGEQFTYDQLVMATGVKLDWHKIKGAREALDDPYSPVVSIYSYETAQKTRKFGKNFKGGKAIFTEPQGPIKCGGAPQKILYLLTKQWQDKNLNFQSEFYKVPPVMFSAPKYSVALTKIAQSYGIKVQLQTKLVEIKKSEKEAVFENLVTKETEVKNFDFLHLVPPMSAYPFIKESGIADDKGFVQVDKDTLQHVRYPNIWSLGDCSNLPTSKTAAAIFSQTEILIKNLRHSLKGQPLTQVYNGYSCCPVFVGGNKLMLAEFLYDGVATKFAQLAHLEIPQRRYYAMKKYFFPFAYFKLVPTGKWAGRKGISTDW